MVSWFSTVTEEEQCMKQPVSANTKKTTNFDLAVFTSMVLLFFSGETNTKRFVYNCNFIQQPHQSSSGVNV